MTTPTSSYNELLPTDMDRARALLGDSDDTAVLFSDEHINAVLTAQGSLYAGLAWLAFELVSRFEQDPVRFSNAAGSMDFSERLKTWRRLAAPVLETLTTANSASTLSFVPAVFGEADRLPDPLDPSFDDYQRRWQRYRP